MTLIITRCVESTIVYIATVYIILVKAVDGPQRVSHCNVVTELSDGGGYHLVSEHKHCLPTHHL